MEFSVQIRGIDQLISKLKQAPEIAAPILQRALSASQAILAKYTVKGIVPWRTGFLAQTFRAELATGVLRWFPTASYAPYVEYGTGIYGTGPGATHEPIVIRPKNKKALYWNGAEHPVRQVTNPGQHPNPFMERIIEHAQSDIDETFGTALKQITDAIATQ
jgi:hypothetical protein